MNRIGKGVAFFLIFCGSLLTSCITFANTLNELSWLPLLTADIKKLQPDSRCPQNQLNDLQVDKSSKQIKIMVSEVNWDLSCVTSKKNQPLPLSEKEQNKQIEKILEQLFTLPNFKSEVQLINITSALIKTTFSSRLSVKKTPSKLIASLKSELLKAKLVFDFNSQKLAIDANFSLEKLPRYIYETDLANKYLNGDLEIEYKSKFKQWHKGEFNIAWQGRLADLSDNANFLAIGSVNLFQHQITLSKFSAQAKQIQVVLSDKQSWKTNYIKWQNPSPIIFNYQQQKAKELPLHIRIGRSSLLTKIERGKSKRIRVDKQNLPPVFLQLSGRGEINDLKIDWKLSSLNQTLIGTFLLTPDLAKLQLLENTLDIKTLFESLRNYTDKLAFVEIEKGIITLAVLTEYNRITKTIAFESTLATDDVAGKQDNILFDGVRLSSHLHYFIDERKKINVYQDDQMLKIENLFIGLPVQAIQIDAKLQAGDPVVQHFKARLLGGRLDFDDFRLNAPSSTMLNVAGISLTEVIKYSAYPEIQSQGIIDGMFPLSLTDDGPEINEGIIFARPPGGFIKVPENTVIKAMGRGNPAFSFTMQLLSNFQFDTMQGRIGYTHDGESDLKIKIKGLNPTVSGTQPITFNYSHNENILKLLKSLRFNEELVRDIKERY